MRLLKSPLRADGDKPHRSPRFVHYTLVLNGERGRPHVATVCVLTSMLNRDPDVGWRSYVAFSLRRARAELRERTEREPFREFQLARLTKGVTT